MLLIGLMIFCAPLLHAVEEQAPKGSLIEVSFIIQNKIVSLKDLRNTLSSCIAQSISAVKHLEQEETVVRSNAASSEVVFSLHQDFLYSNTFQRAFYPEFITMIDYYSTLLADKASKLPDEAMAQGDAQKLVEEANYIHDLVYAQSCYIADLLDLHAHNNKIKHEELAERLYTKIADDRTVPFDPKKNAEYTKIKQRIKNLYHTKVTKQREINKLKKKIAHAYNKLHNLGVTKFSKQGFYKLVMESQKQADTLVSKSQK